MKFVGYIINRRQVSACTWVILYELHPIILVLQSTWCMFKCNSLLVRAIYPVDKLVRKGGLELYSQNYSDGEC